MGLTVCLADGAVNAATVPAAKLGGPILKNVELCFELGEYEDLVPLLQETRHEAVEKEHLARCSDKSLVDGSRVVAPWPVEIMRGVTSETGLHDRILQLLLSNFFLCVGSLARVSGL